MGDYCECLDGRCGEVAVTTVQDVRCCPEHAKALRRVTARRVCPECQRNLAGPRGGICATCQHEHERKARAA